MYDVNPPFKLRPCRPWLKDRSNQEGAQKSLPVLEKLVADVDEGSLNVKAIEPIGGHPVCYKLSQVLTEAAAEI